MSSFLQSMQEIYEINVIRDFVARFLQTIRVHSRFCVYLIENSYGENRSDALDRATLGRKSEDRLKIPSTPGIVEDVLLPYVTSAPSVQKEGNKAKKEEEPLAECLRRCASLPTVAKERGYVSPFPKPPARNLAFPVSSPLPVRQASLATHSEEEKARER